MLYTASFYEPAHWTGTRYRISRSHPRGRKTDWQPQPALYPSRALLSAYRQGEIGFAELDAAYRSELDTTLQKDADFRAFLEQLPAAGDFTLLCFEPANAPCHRRSAAAWLLERAPALTLGRLR